jgi:hypothetical protein
LIPALDPFGPMLFNIGPAPVIKGRFRDTAMANPIGRRAAIGAPSKRAETPAANATETRVERKFVGEYGRPN